MKVESLILIKFHFGAERLPCNGIYFFFYGDGENSGDMAEEAAASSFCDSSPTAPRRT
jgi:hypothetical protein